MKHSMAFLLNLLNRFSAFLGLAICSVILASTSGTICSGADSLSECQTYLGSGGHQLAIISKVKHRKTPIADLFLEERTLVALRLGTSWSAKDESILRLSLDTFSEYSPELAAVVGKLRVDSSPIPGLSGSGILYTRVLAEKPWTLAAIAIFSEIVKKNTSHQAGLSFGALVLERRQASQNWKTRIVELSAFVSFDKTAEVFLASAASKAESNVHKPKEEVRKFLPERLNQHILSSLYSGYYDRSAQSIFLDAGSAVLNLIPVSVSHAHSHFFTLAKILQLIAADPTVTGIELMDYQLIRGR